MSAGTPRDIDRLLEAWFDEGPSPAAERVVGAAMAQVEQMAQSQPLWPPRAWGGRDPRPARTLTVAIAVLALFVAAVGIGIGVGLIRLPTPTPSPQPTDLTNFAPADSGIAFGVPIGWTQTQTQNFEMWQYSGIDPTGRFSLSFGTPISVSFCPADCFNFLFDMPLPYSADKTTDVLAAKISEITGIAAWEPLEEAMVPGLEAGRSLERIVADAAWGESRETIIVGAFQARAVTLTWTQPAASFDPALLSAFMRSVEFDPAGPQYASGDLFEVTNQTGGYALLVPDIWYSAGQPTLDGEPASGVRRFGERELAVSIGDIDGAIRLCAAACDEFREQTSLEALDATLSAWMPPPALGSMEAQGEITLGGESARFLRREVTAETGPRTRYVAYGLHLGRPFVVSFDVPSDAVSQEVIDEIVASFTFLAPPADLPSVMFSPPDGSFELRLPEAHWHATTGDDATALYLERGGTELTIRFGDADGRVQTCDEPAGPWEVCQVAIATSLEDLADAVAFQPIAEEGVGPPVSTSDTTSLDGEPALLIEIQAYEYPARGGEWVAYVVAMHDGRPLIMRFWTGAESGLNGVVEVFAGFRFVD